MTMTFGLDVQAATYSRVISSIGIQFLSLPLLFASIPCSPFWLFGITKCFILCVCVCVCVHGYMCAGIQEHVLYVCGNLRHCRCQESHLLPLRQGLTEPGSH